MPERRRRKPLWQRRELWLGCLGAGLLLGATCPLWPAEQRHVCVSFSHGLRHVALSMLGLPAPSSAPLASSSGDGGAP